MAPCSSSAWSRSQWRHRHVVGTPFRHQRPEARTVTEDPQVGQLVDDDGLEGLGRGQDESPRERQAAAARRAPPARAWVADRDDRRADIEALGVPRDDPLDLGPGPGAEPRLEDDGRGSTIRGGTTNDDQVLAVATDTFHARSPDARPGRLETQSMEVAAIADQGAVLQAAPRRELLARVGLASEVAAEPRLPLREERGDVAFRVGPSPPAGGRDRHDDAPLRMDDHAQRARPRRPPERVRDGPARQARDRGLLGGPGCRAGHAPRRRRRPGRCPVS